MDGRDRHSSNLRRSDSPIDQALALVVTPLLMGLFGAFLDHRFGTGPALMLAFVVFGAVGAFLSAYYRYRERMALDDRGKPWTYRSR
ncbi:MAG: AtpZ/AtpI family protein [Acidimicrobiia bacterium]|nr:AtpZ/AtpI family protein [Acidimicrobiia bacterium]MCL4291988.1 AtpZ/AtpI family protein [Acidimicrobiia bacterium]